jgi:FkbM family methyltransferase
MNLSGISNDSLIGRALRLPLRLIPKGACVPILQGPLRGKRWIVGSSTNGCWLGSYEYRKQRALSAKVRRGFVVYDLGAHVGFYSLLASTLVGSEGRVFSFEPAPNNLKILKRHLTLNHVHNCTIFEAAVGSQSGTAAFDLGPGSSEGSLKTQGQAGAAATLTVRVCVLDELAAAGQIMPPDVIKCDIEGGEYDALRGASRLLQDHRPAIFLATHNPQVHDQCCALLRGFRYQLTSLDGLAMDQSREILAMDRAHRAKG